MSDPVVGRAGEIAEILGALRSGPVLVSGPPGIGKTTVLRAVAARWGGPVSFVDGGWSEVRTQLQVPPDGQLSRALAARPGHLVVVDDAGAEPLEPGVGTDGGARVLLAGRTAMPGVRVLELRPLSVELASRVYLQAARSVGWSLPIDRKAVSLLCRRLDGWPLAVELAGRRIRTLAPDDPGLLAALTRTEPVAAVLAEVLETLAPDELRVLGATALFEGGFDRAAFATVTGADGELLERWVDGSLVTVEGPGRVRLRALFREHLRKVAPADPSAGDRHRAWVVAEGERHLQAWRRTGAAAPLEALRPELQALSGDPVAACLLAELALRRGPLTDPLEVMPPSSVRVVATRARILRRQLRNEAALNWLDRGPAPRDDIEAAVLARERIPVLLALGRTTEADLFLPALEAPTPPEHAAENALVAAVLHLRHGRVSRAVAGLRAATTLVDQATHPDLWARVAAHLGAVLRTEDPESAVRWLESALTWWKAVGDTRWQGVAGGWLGLQLHDLGAPAESLAALETAARCSALAGLVSFEVIARVGRAAVFLESRDLDAAHVELLAAEALGTMTATGQSGLRGHQGLYHLRRGDPARAVGFLRQARDGYRALGSFGSVATWSALATVAAAAGGLDPADDLAHLQSATRHAPDPTLEAVTAAVVAGQVSAELRVLAAGRSDLRMLIAIADDTVTTISLDGRTVTLRTGTRLSFGNRPTLVRLLACLAAAGPGVEVPREALLASGWPGQRQVGTSGTARLHVAMSTLRKAGVPIHTVDTAGGLAYALEATVRLTP